MFFNCLLAELRLEGEGLWTGEVSQLEESNDGRGRPLIGGGSSDR